MAHREVRPIALCQRAPRSVQRCSTTCLGPGRWSSVKTPVTVDSAPRTKAQGAARAPRIIRRGYLRRQVIPYLFVLPFLILFVAFFVAPLLYAFQQSLFKEHRSGLGFGPPRIEWAGAANYLQ